MPATLARPVPAATDACDCLADRGQRSILTLDVLRECGNVYPRHAESGKPPVVDHEVIADGRALEDPAPTTAARRSTPTGAA